MGLRGPPAEAPDLKIARGTPGKRRVDNDTPELEALAVAPPGDLKGLALKEWVRLAADLIAAGILSKADMGTFKEYCKLFAEIDKVEKKIKRVGFEDAMAKGYNNYLLKTRAQYLLAASKLGLTPTTRHAVKKIKGKQQTAEGRSRFFSGREQAIG